MEDRLKESLNSIYKSHDSSPKEALFIPVLFRLFKQRWYIIVADVKKSRCITFEGSEISLINGKSVNKKQPFKAVNFRYKVFLEYLDY